MLKITDSARDKFKELMVEHPGKCLRVVFEGFGWGGPKLGLALDELKEEEKIHTINEIDFMIDENVVSYTKDNQIDYIDNEQGQGFSIGPINSTGCC